MIDSFVDDSRIKREDLAGIYADFSIEVNFLSYTECLNAGHGYRFTLCFGLVLRCDSSEILRSTDASLRA